MKAIEILVIDDDSDDVQFFQQALNDAMPEFTLLAFFDAEAAFTHLERRVQDGEPLPDAIVTDLNMPRVEGHRVISYLKANAHFHHIPVIVVSVSKRGEDSEKSFMLGASGYFVKPLRDEDWFPIIQSISDLVDQSRTERTAF